MGPILLDNVTCDQRHSELLQCVPPLGIGIHDCNRENVAGVICPNKVISTITTTTDSPPFIFASTYTDFGLGITSLTSTK